MNIIQNFEVASFYCKNDRNRNNEGHKDCQQVNYEKFCKSEDIKIWSDFRVRNDLHELFFRVLFAINGVELCFEKVFFEGIRLYPLIINLHIKIKGSIFLGNSISLFGYNERVRLVLLARYPCMKLILRMIHSVIHRIFHCFLSLCFFVILVYIVFQFGKRVLGVIKLPGIVFVYLALIGSILEDASRHISDHVVCVNLHSCKFIGR